MKKKFTKPTISEVDIEKDIEISDDYLIEDIQVFAPDERGGGGY